MPAPPESSVDADVVVVGTGGAGLTAAIVAHDHGAKVVVLEKSSKVGGTTAMSGGVVWIPLNHHMPGIGAADTREAALTYCMALAGDRADAPLVEAFVDNGHRMVRYLEDKTPLKFVPVAMPDYRPEQAGGTLRGRALAGEIFSLSDLGDAQDKLRRSGTFVVPITIDEVFTTYQAFYRPQNIPMDVVVERMQAGQITCGVALVAPLFKACIDRNIPIHLETRATRLRMADGSVAGVEATSGEATLRIKARRGVILACGGFEWNDELKKAFLPGPVPFPNSVPTNEGDGLIMAMEAGASLGNMTEIWGYPTAVIPGEKYEGKQLARAVKAERAAPHCILVNGRGVRFANEAANYNDLGKTFNAFDATTFTLSNLPCWAIFDRQYRMNYSVLSVVPGDPDPTWVTKADTVAEIAARIGVDPAQLGRTVDRWNEMARAGRDLDFQRGESAFDKYQGDHQAPHPSLGTVEQAPFYALQIFPGTIGTKGGPRTNDRGQVLNIRGEVIRGLFAAGNVMSAPSGAGYFGPGGTLGPGMTWGYLCGLNAARQ